MQVILRETEEVSPGGEITSVHLQPRACSGLQTNEPAQSTKAALRKFVAETNIQLQAMPDELVDLLIKYGNNPDGIPALHAAIKAKDENAVRLFLLHGANPNSKSRGDIPLNPESPLYALDYAAAYGNAAIVNLLIDAGATVNPLPILLDDNIYQPCTPLIFAAGNNNSETILALVHKGANMFCECGNSVLTPLHHAARHNKLGAIKTLITLGVPVDLIGGYEKLTPLMCLLEISIDPESIIPSVEFLLEAGAKPNCKTVNGFNLLMLLIFRRFDDRRTTKLAKLFVDYGVDVNATFSDHTVLYFLKQNWNNMYPQLIALLESLGAVAK